MEQKSLSKIHGNDIMYIEENETQKALKIILLQELYIDIILLF